MDDKMEQELSMRELAKLVITPGLLAISIFLDVTEKINRFGDGTYVLFVVWVPILLSIIIQWCFCLPRAQPRRVLFAEARIFSTFTSIQIGIVSFFAVEWYTRQQMEILVNILLNVFNLICEDYSEQDVDIIYNFGGIMAFLRLFLLFFAFLYASIEMLPLFSYDGRIILLCVFSLAALYGKITLKGIVWLQQRYRGEANPKSLYTLVLIKCGYLPRENGRETNDI
jgi:hypothetical protein